MWLGLTLLIFVGLITWLLVAPLQLQIDMPANAYLLRWRGIATARLIPLADDLLIRLQIFFWHVFTPNELSFKENEICAYGRLLP